MREYPRRLHYKTPGWVQDDSLFHVRIRVLPTQSMALTAPELASQLLAAAQRYHDPGHWWCELFLLMPDHLHVMAAFPSAPGMSAVLRNWKRGTARFQHVLWQEGYFDHRLRDEKAAREKWDYIRRNPVVKNLCAAAADWPWWWSGIANNPLRAPK